MFQEVESQNTKLYLNWADLVLDKNKDFALIQMPLDFNSFTPFYFADTELVFDYEDTCIHTTVGSS